MAANHFEFRITGQSLNTILSQLKKGFPRKYKDEAKSAATIHVRPGHATFGLCGVSAKAAVTTSDCFSAEIPFSELILLTEEKFKPDEDLLFSFEPGCMGFRCMKIRNPHIYVVEILDPDDIPLSVHTPDSVLPKPPGDPLIGFVGYPLLSVYQIAKKYTPEALVGNPRIREGMAEIEEILSKVHTLLKPLGLGREDIIRLIHKRIGIQE